jgi:thiol-disulfide isomerase/thioredoxin
MKSGDWVVFHTDSKAFPTWQRRFHELSLASFLVLAVTLPARLAWAQAPPANDNFANALPILGTNITVTGNNDYATKEPGEPDHAGNIGGKSVWWTWQAPFTAFVTISTRGSTSDLYSGPLDTVLAVYTGSAVNALTEVASNDEDPATYYTSRVGFKTTAGTLYRIAVDGYTYDTPADADSGTIALSLTVSAMATNDDFANATVLTGTNLTVFGNNDAASKEPGEPDHAGDPGGKSVWWTWQAPALGFVTLSTQGSLSSQTSSDLEALLAVYLGDSVSNLAVVADGSGSPATVNVRVDAGKTYRIAVDGYNWGTPGDADSGAIRLSLQFSPGLPLAPPWGPIPDIYGNLVNSTDFAGKVILLNFWATWCPPCVAEIPDLVAVYQKYSTDGLVVVGVSMDTSPDGINPPTSLVSNFAFSKGMYYPVLMDRPSWWGIENGFGSIALIPTTFVIDRQNHICAKFVGSQSYATFESAALPLLYANLSVDLTFAGGQPHLSWPVTQATFVLETSTTLAPGSWTPVTAPVQSDGINQFVDLPTVAGGQFFRLRSQ